MIFVVSLGCPHNFHNVIHWPTFLSMASFSFILLVKILLDPEAGRFGFMHSWLISCFLMFLYWKASASSSSSSESVSVSNYYLFKRMVKQLSIYSVNSDLSAELLNVIVMTQFPKWKLLSFNNLYKKCTLWIWKKCTLQYIVDKWSPRSF